MQILKEKNKQLQSDKEIRDNLLKKIEALRNNKLSTTISPKKFLNSSVHSNYKQSKAYLSPSPDKTSSIGTITYERHPIKPIIYRKESYLV